jgi:uncharacterized protein DUF3768
MSTDYNADDTLAQISASEQIRTLNDAFRTHPFIGAALASNELVITRGVADYGNDFADRAVTAVRRFSDFTEDNDPYGEHDFGSFDLDAVKLFWKIDYYDRKLEYGSPDPADPAVTRRVLTILLAEEY